MSFFWWLRLEQVSRDPDQMIWGILDDTTLNGDSSCSISEPKGTDIVANIRLGQIPRLSVAPFD